MENYQEPQSFASSIHLLHLVHAASCWIRTHMLSRDLATCLARYAECGGERLNETRAIQAADAAPPANPTNHLGCTDYYRDEADLRVVMARNPSFAFGASAECCRLPAGFGPKLR